MNKKIGFFIGIMLCITLCVSGCDLATKVEKVSAQEEPLLVKPLEEDKPIEPETVDIRITAVGDIMVHGPQLRAQYNNQSKNYDFTNNFRFVKAYIQASDLALCNLETTFAGEEKGYSSYPRFNSPDSLGEALKDTGFDIIVTANNHAIDTGAQGLIRTKKALEDIGLKVIGTKKNINEDKFIIQDIKGVKIGITAYTYETPKQGGIRTVNALPITKDLEGLLNTFSYEELDKSYKEMELCIAEMKSQGAELIIFYIHWGNEYQRMPSAYQMEMAQFLAEKGVNIIFGSHPHVIQPIELIESSIGNSTWVAYSMGNFLSNQRYEILKNRYTEDGLLVHIDLVKNLENGIIEVKEVSYVPTWVHRYPFEGKNAYEIIPLDKDIIDSLNYGLKTEDSIWRAKNSRHNTLELMKEYSHHMVQLLKTKAE